MRIAVGLPQAGGDVEELLRAATDAEEAGAWGVFVFDHLSAPWNAHAPLLDGWALLGVLARHTRRARLVSLVTRAGVRSPRVVAGMASVVSAASGGRLVLGLGTGDARTAAEERRFGIRSVDRTRRVEEVEATTRLLSSEGTRPHGTRPPVWIGSARTELVDLAARVGAGWHAWELAPDRFADRARRLRRLAGEGGECWWGGVFRPREAEGLLDELEGAGADGVTWSVSSRREEGDRAALLELVARRS